ncbi:MAG: polysaccharide biosynthesis C-terminal domain-containing protein [Clostridia bacterium]|nr:polysaccharide biosynthesis C-terminal domain-containing protein [Clostridia bacterium]
MNKYKTLLSNTLLISIGTFGSKLLVFLMVRFYTGYLTPSDYSTADLITQTANLLFPIISLGITEGVFRFALDNNIQRKSVFTLGLFSITTGAVLFLGIVPILNAVQSFKGFVWLIVIYTMASCYHSLCSQYIRAVGKTALFAVQGIINTILVITLNIIFLAAFNLGVTGYVLSVVVADTLCTLFLFIKEKLWSVITLKPQKTVLPAMLKYSIPLIPTTVFWWITSVSDRYMVVGFIGSEANGLYSVSYKLPTLLTLVATIFMQAWQFSAVSEAEGDRAEHAKFFGQVWQSFQAIMFLAGSAVIAFAKPAMMLLTSKEYYEAWKFVPLLSVSMVFTAFTSFMGTVYVVNKKSGLSFITALIGASTNIVLNLILIPSRLGVQGAALATAISYFTVFVIRAVNVRKYIPFKMQSVRVAFNSAVLCLQSAVVILGFKGWILTEALCLLAVLMINSKLLFACAEKLLSPFLRRVKKNA